MKNKAKPKQHIDPVFELGFLLLVDRLGSPLEKQAALMCEKYSHKSIIYTPPFQFAPSIWVKTYEKFPFYAFFKGLAGSKVWTGCQAKKTLRIQGRE